FSENGSQDAFSELVRRRFDLVYAVAFRQVGGDAHLARDVAQRVFTDLARKAKTLSPRVVISGWLHRSATFAASDMVRSERHRRAREQEACKMEDWTTDPITDADGERLRPLLDVAISELRPRDRDALMLRVVEQRTFPEIGSALRLSEDAARMRVDRALEKLRVRLRRRGVTSTAAALTLVLASQSAIAAPGGLAAAVATHALASAGATAAASGLATFAVFMSTSKTTAAISAIAASAFIATGVHQTAKLHAASEAAEILRQERDQLASRRAALSAAAPEELTRLKPPSRPTSRSGRTPSSSSRWSRQRIRSSSPRGPTRRSGGTPRSWRAIYSTSDLRSRPSREEPSSRSCGKTPSGPTGAFRPRPST
ncbi:MAG: RNA polymerase sigma factor, partial [Opitutaceae bacterium]